MILTSLKDYDGSGTIKIDFSNNTT